MNFRNFTTGVFVYGLSATFSMALAGDVTVGDIPRAEPPRALPSIAPAEIKKEVKPAYQAPTGGNDIKVLIKSFTFSGNQSFSQQALSAALADYQQREISFKELNEAVQVITAFYRERGYFLAQAYLPAQDIAENKVEIVILEGQLGALKLLGATDLDKASLSKLAGHQLSKGDTVTEYNLVRNVTLLNRLPGLAAIAQLNPGQDVGETDTHVTLQPAPRLQGYIGANTYGNRFTGREVVLAGLQLNNAAGLGDQLSLSLKRSNDEGQRGLGLSYVTPINSAATVLNVGYNYIGYQLGGNFKNLDASGQSQYFNLSIDHSILRDAHKGLSARLGTSYKLVNDEVGFAALENKRNISAADIGLNAGWTNATSSVNYLLGASLRTGSVNFKDDTYEALDATAAKTKGGFIKYNVNFSRQQFFNHGFSMALHADYQRASKNLDSVEKLSIGGINRWRQFAELPSLADTGLVVGAELRKNIPSQSQRFLLSLSPYGFIDIGRGKINQRPAGGENHVKSIHGGFGLDATFANRWLFSLVGSHHNRDFSGADAENEVRVWGQLIKQF